MQDAIRDGVIRLMDPKTKTVELTVKFHSRRVFPSPVTDMLLHCLSKGIEEWQNRVIIMDSQSNSEQE